MEWRGTGPPPSKLIQQQILKHSYGQDMTFDTPFTTMQQECIASNMSQLLHNETIHLQGKWLTLITITSYYTSLRGFLTLKIVKH